MSFSMLLNELTSTAIFRIHSIGTAVTIIYLLFMILNEPLFMINNSSGKHKTYHISRKIFKRTWQKSNGLLH